MTAKKPKKKRFKPGPQPERVKIREDWERAIDKALEKKRPKEGWPDQEGGHSGKNPKK